MADSAPREAAHVVDQVQGGGAGVAPKVRKPKPRRVYLRMVDAPAAFEPRAGLPAGGRDECRTGERPCPYVRCKYHLWLVLPEDRQGRRGGRRQGEPIGPDGDRERTGSTTLEPRWLEHPTPPCCARDVQEATKQAGDVTSFEVIAKAMGRHHTTVRVMLARAIEKLKARGLELKELVHE